MAQQAPPQFVLKWGSHGSGAGEFDEPAGVVADDSGYVYVADRQNHRIQKFDGNGVFLTEWGRKGTGPGDLNAPNNIAVSPAGDLYVADHRVQRFDRNGVYLGPWETGSAEIAGLVDIDIDDAGQVYILDGCCGSDARVSKFGADGRLIAQWGSRGSEIGQFWHPSGIAVDAQGNVYTVEQTPNRVQKFSSDGQFILSWGGCCAGDGEFDRAQDIHVSNAELVYVADAVNSRIQVFTLDGEFVTKWGSRCVLRTGEGCAGEGDGQFSPPQGVTVDLWENVYVADRNNNRIQKFGVTTSVQRTSWGQLRGRYREE